MIQNRVLIKLVICLAKMLSEYDQEISQSQTADKPVYSYYKYYT